MVGFHKHDSLTNNQKLVAGCFSGVITRFLTQPLDIIKLRTQLQKNVRGKKRKGLYKVAKRILFEEGITAFWHGHTLGQLHSILSVSSQFFVYEMTTKYYATSLGTDHHSPALRFTCGVFAGCTSATLVVPLEVIRVRQMIVKDQYGGILKGGRAVYRYGGIFAFYEGLTASLLQMGPQVGISFTVFSYTQSWILRFINLAGTENIVESKDNLKVHDSNMGNKHSAQHVLFASSIAGAIAGFISKTVTYPFDLAKRRLQIGSHKASRKYQVPSTSRNLIQCKNLTDCITKTFRKEGLVGLFRGWSVTVWKAQVTSIVAFTTYELFCYGIREVNVTSK